MQIISFPSHYQLVYISFDISSFSVISYDVIINYTALYNLFYTSVEFDTSYIKAVIMVLLVRLNTNSKRVARDYCLPILIYLNNLSRHILSF